MELIEAKEFQITAEHMEEILSWCNNHIDSLLTNRKAAMRMRLVMEEALVNVFRYAYKGSDKEPIVALKVGKDGEFLCFEMADQGIPFNPLENITADPNLKLFERTEGGWGRSIMVSFTDASEYCYKDGWNVLTLKKLDIAPVIVNKKKHLAK